MKTVFLFATLLTFLGLGLPIAMALGLSSILTILLFEHDSLASLALAFFQTMDQFTLLAIPFFILAANFLTTGGVAKRMINFAIAAVGHLPGGLAIASVLACMLFAAVSGSSPATVVAIGSIVIAGMVRGRLHAVLCHRRDRQCRHARHPDPALDRDGGLRGRDRNLGRPAVHGRRRPGHPARPVADGRDLRGGAHQEAAAPAQGAAGASNFACSGTRCGGCCSSSS